MKLALQFPKSVVQLASFASIAALFPGAIIAVESEEQALELEDNVAGNVMVVEDLAPPTADVHLNLFYQIAAQSLPIEALSPQARQDAYRRDGYLAYQEGQYDEAIKQWGLWLAEDPSSAEALALIGRAYVQKDEPTEALDYYTRSLEVNPGQINLVIRRAELLEKLDRNQEAREQLNLYARVFPENPDILIAQAQWLDRHKRRMEARSMLETLVEEAPANLSARLALLNMQEEPRERYNTMREVLNLGRSPDAHVPFGHSLLGMEMLTFPESGVFFDFIRQQARRGEGTKQQVLYESFLPLTNRVTDDFASGQLSDGWIASGGIRTLNQGRYELRAAIDQSETYLRLRRSELMRDGFLEVVMDETHGFFWIYARRSSRAMVRFGFDQEGNIHLQAWHEGNMMANMTRPWIRPPGALKMRMEIRGDGARGFVNDLEIFDAPLEIPEEVAYGWWGVAPFAFDLGIARVRIIRMDCEPLPTTMVLLPPGDPEEQITQLRPYVGGMSALMPAWIFQNPDGTIPDRIPSNSGTLRMFSSFHQIRLLPVIDLSYDGNVDPVQVVELIQRYNLPGATIKRRTPPPKEWMDTLREALEAAPANVIVLQTESALWDIPEAEEELRGQLVARPGVDEVRFPGPDDPVGVWELPVGSVLVPPLKSKWKLPLHLPDEDPASIIQDCSTPQLYILGTNGVVALPSPP
jgi:tetratricopeptide (TPR) repeat protein